MIDWNTATHKSQPQFAKDVIEEIKLLSRLFNELFSRTHTKQLNQILTDLQPFSTDNDTSNRHGGSHRLAKFSHESPIYTSMDPDKFFGENFESENVITCQRVARLVLLLSFFNAIKLTKTSTLNLASFCRNFRQRHIEVVEDTYFGDINQSFNKNLIQKNWNQAIVLCDKLLSADDLTIPRNYKLQLKNLLPALIILREYKPIEQEYINSYVQFPADKNENFKRIPPTIITIDGDEDTNDVNPDSSIEIITANSAENTNESDEVRLALAIRGNYIQMTGMYSGQTPNALIPHEAQLCMDWLRNFKPSDTSENIAQILWILVGISGFRFDNLLLGFTKINTERPPLPKLNCTQQVKNILIEHSHIIQHKLPVETHHCYTAVSQTSQVPIFIPENFFNTSILTQLTNISNENDSLVIKIIAAKKRIKHKIRNSVCDRFIETRWRGAIIQQTFNECQDTPLLQFIWGEPFNTSTAALHYVAWDRSYITNIIRTSVQKLFKIEHKSITTPEPEETLAGAQRAGLGLTNFKKSIELLLSDLSEKSKNLKSLTKKIEQHNLLANHLGLLLGFCTASRNNNDFHNMTLNQISLSAKLAIFEDKRSDPAILRRATALCDYVVYEIYRYIDSLIIMADHARKHTTSISIYNLKIHIDAILESKKPLLFEIIPIDTKKERLTTIKIKPWLGREAFKQYLNSDITPNSFRHIFSRWMRTVTDIPALFIETQLGHNAGYSLFDNDSVISPLEYAHYMQSPLSEYLRKIGYPINNIYKPQRHLYTQHTKSVVWRNLEQFEKNQIKNDLQTIQSIKKINTDNLKSSTIRQSILMVLSEKFGIKGKKSPLKNNVTLSKEETNKIYQQVLERAGNSIGNIEKTAKLLRIRLKQLRDQKNWQVTLPPPIMWRVKPPIPLGWFHLAAYEELIKLREILSLSYSNKPINTGELILIFLAFGGATNFIEAHEIFINADNHIADRHTGCWFIDINKPIRASRTVSGIPLMVLNKWLKNEWGNNKNLTLYNFICLALDSLPTPWTLTTKTLTNKKDKITCLEKTQIAFENLLKYARYIELPPILDAIHNSRKTSRELTSERLQQWIHQKGNNTQLEDDIDHDDAQTTINTHRNNPTITELRYQKRQLKQTIIGRITTETQKTPTRPIRRAKTAVIHIKTNPNTAPLIAMLANWAEILLSDHANMRSGGKLVTNTVADYINIVADVLIPIYAEKPLDSLDEDSLLFLLDEQLSDSLPKRSDQSSRLTRLFYEIPSNWNVPKITLGSHFSDQPVELTIDAGVMTQPEIDHTQQQLIRWGENSKLPNEIQTAITEGALYFSSTAQLGTRRSELQFIQKRDRIVYDKDYSCLKVRMNRQRRIKSHAAERILYVKNITLPTIQNNINDSYIYSAMAEKKLGSRILSTIHLSMRYSTGDKNSHLHHLRHSKGTRNFEQIFTTKNIHERIKKTCELTLAIGHTKPSTTATHYSHNLRYIIATKYTPPVNAISQSFISKLSGKKTSFVNRIIHEEDNVNDISKRLINPSTINRLNSIYRKPLIPNPPRLLLGSTLTPENIIDSLYSIIANKKSLLSTKKSAISAEEKNNLIKTLIDNQFQHGWEAVDTQELKKIIDYKNNKITFSNKRNIDKKIIENWIKKISTSNNNDVYEALMIIGKHIPYADLTKNNVLWRINDETKNNISIALKITGIPIKLIKDDLTKAHHVVLTPSPKKSSKTTIKILLTILICLINTLKHKISAN